MKTTVGILAAALFIAPVNAIQREGNVITITDEEAAACEAGGGLHRRSEGCDSACALGGAYAHASGLRERT